MDKIIKIITAIAIIVAVLSVGYFISQTSKTSETTLGLGDHGPVYFFYGEGCPHCAIVMPLIVNLSKKYPDAHIQILEVWQNETNQGIYNSVNQQMGISQLPGVPEVIIGKTILVGDRDIPQQFEGLIQKMLKK
ncbi:MAG: thioredoxin family protein [Methanoregulaceae archaeon]|jgi:thiol-disulfide isomerase/thioredoxin